MTFRNVNRETAREKLRGRNGSLCTKSVNREDVRGIQAVCNKWLLTGAKFLSRESIAPNLNKRATSRNHIFRLTD